MTGPRPGPLGEPVITQSPRELWSLAAVLMSAGRDKEMPPGFADGWLACCKAIAAIGDEQAERVRVETRTSDWSPVAPGDLNDEETT